MMVGASCRMTIRTMVSIAVAAALEHPRQPAGLALQVEAQRQLMHVLEGADGEPPHRMHRHLGEQAVAKLRQRGHHDAHAAIGDGQGNRSRKHPCHPRIGSDRGASLPGQRVDCPFVGERDRDRGELGDQQQQGRLQHAELEVAPVGRPDIGPQVDERGHQRTAGDERARHRLGRLDLLEGFGVSHSWARNDGAEAPGAPPQFFALI